MAARQQAEAATGLGGTGTPGQHLHLEVQRTQITARAEYLRSQVRKVIRELLVADRGADAVAKTLRQPLTADLDISTASREQLREIHRVMVPVQRKLATTVMRKRRHPQPDARSATSSMPASSAATPTTAAPCGSSTARSAPSSNAAARSSSSGTPAVTTFRRSSSTDHGQGFLAGLEGTSMKNAAAP